MASQKQVTIKTAVKKAAKPAVNANKTVAKAAKVKKLVPIKLEQKPISPKKIKPAANLSNSKAKIAVEKVVPVKKLSKSTVAADKEVKKALTVKKVTIPVKVIINHSSKAPEKAVNPAQKIMAKKDDTKKVTTKEAVTKEATSKPVADVKAKDIKVPTAKAVAIPKISTKTVRKYEPEFTKSLLDKAAVNVQGPTLRYSDSELQEFRELIQRKLEAAKKELSYLHGLITRKDEMGGDEGDNRYLTLEDGSLSMEREQLSQMASRQITFIDHLEKAVMRLENKTYGICRVTGKLIDKARLRAVPHATLSIEAKMSGSR